MGSNFMEEEKIVEEITLQRNHVLQKFSDFERKALKKRDILIQSVKLQHFNRSVGEVNQSIEEIILKVENISLKRVFEHLLQVSKSLEHLKSTSFGLEANVKAIESAASRLIEETQLAKKEIEDSSQHCRQRWNYLISLLDEKLESIKKQLRSIDFCRKCEILLNWISRVKNIEWTPETNRLRFDEIRKKAVIWTELKNELGEMQDATPHEIEAFETVKNEWIEFQKFVDSLMKEMDEQERVTQFLENAEDIRKWIADKEKEIHEKFSKMGVEQSLKYRKTIEIELSNVKQRLEDLKKKKEHIKSADFPLLDEEINKTENKYKTFVDFVKIWLIDVKQKAEIEGIFKEAEEIQYWCSEKLEDLSQMQKAEPESVNCDEIATWIETNLFDLNSWDIVVESFAKSAQRIIEQNHREGLKADALLELLENVTKSYDLTKRTSEEVNERLQERIKTIFIEEQIFQTHAKASHLVQLLKNEWTCDTSDQVEKFMRMIDGLIIRCASVVEQIETVEKEIESRKHEMSPGVNNLIDEMRAMKDVLRTSCDKKKEKLQQRLDMFYLLDNSEELKEHTSNILKNLKTEIHKEAKLKSSKNRILPLKEQLEKVVHDYQYLEPIIAEGNDKQWSSQMQTQVLENIEEIKDHISRIIEEHDVQLNEYVEKRHIDNTAQFVERVERWVKDTLAKIDDEENGYPLKCQNLRRIVSSCKQAISIGDKYIDVIRTRKEKATELDEPPIEVIHLLTNIEDVLMEFESAVQKRIDETEMKIIDYEQMNELNGHNDWIRSKVKFLSADPDVGNLLAAQKHMRRYENDSEEIENRRKSINDIIMDVKRVQNVPNSYLQLIDEIEKNWSYMKELFDERGTFLERVIKLLEYDAESDSVWEWIREKLMIVDSIMERKDDEEINRIMLKKMDDLMTEVINFEPQVEHSHKRLEDALIQHSSQDSQQKTAAITNYESNLTKKQGSIERDYIALKRNTEKKSRELNQSLQEHEVNREIYETERWIEEQEVVLNRMFKKDNGENESEIKSKLDDVEAALNGKRSNLTDIKCSKVLDGANMASTQKIDDAFSMLDVFAFELDRMRQKAGRNDKIRKLKNEFDDVIYSIQATCESLEFPKQSGRERWRKVENGNIENEMESLKRRVIVCLSKAKEVRGANADLATQVYEMEENMEKEWLDLEKLVDRKQRASIKEKLADELRAAIIDLEQWLDTFNEEIAVITGDIRDNLGVQVALESIDTWREELIQGSEKLNSAKNLMVQIRNGQDEFDTESTRNENEKLFNRLDNVTEDFAKAMKTIDTKNDFLIDFLEILQAERSLDRLYSWVVSKRSSLEDDFNNNQNAKTMIRKMGEIEKMMINRANEIEELKTFVDSLKRKPNSFERTEVEEKFDNLMEEWGQLEDDLKKREIDFNESMSQLHVEEEFEKISQWIEKKTEATPNRETSDLNGEKVPNLEKCMEQYDTILNEIREFQPIYEDFLRNEFIDEEKVELIRVKWTTLVETTKIKRKRLTHEIEKRRIFEMLDSIAAFIADSEADIRSVNLQNMFRTTDCEKMVRKLVGLHDCANEKETLLKTIRSATSAFKSKIGDEDVHKIERVVEDLNSQITALKRKININKEDLEMWRDMQEVVRLIDDEVVWFKELSVMVSSSDVGHDSATLDVIRRKHQRSVVELERRKQKAAKTLDRAAEVLSVRTRENLIPKLDEIDEKVGQMGSLIENIGQLAEIRTSRLEKWSKFFDLLNEMKDKEHVIDQVRASNDASMKRNLEQNFKMFHGEKILNEIKGNLEVLEAVGMQLEDLKMQAEKMSGDEMIRSKTAENNVARLSLKWNELFDELESRRESVLSKIEHVNFMYACDLASQAIGDQEGRISNLVRQNRITSNYDNAQYHSTAAFVEQYSEETIYGLIETTKKLKNSEASEERHRRLSSVTEKLENLKKELNFLAEKINRDADNKKAIQRLQDEYTEKANKIAIWIEQAEEDVADVVCFQTKSSTQECFNTLANILNLMNTEKRDILGDLELLEVELSSYNEDVKTFTWLNFRSLANKMDKLTVTINERMRVVEREIVRHNENEKICKNAAELLLKCKNVIVATKSELDRIPNLTLDAQREKLSNLIEKLDKSGMIEELENLRSLMDSRYIFDNEFSKYTPNGIHIETRHCIELMCSMLRSVEQSMADRDNCGISEQQMKEFENSFDYFDRERKGWLDYEKFELCMKSQGYDFVIEQQTEETLIVLDPGRSGRILKTDYMRWIIKNEKTNVYDDRQAIEDALKSLDTKKLSDSMSRKEAEFFMRKISSHTEVFTEQVHLEYKDFVKSFY